MTLTPQVWSVSLSQIQSHSMHFIVLIKIQPLLFLLVDILRRYI